MVDLQEEVDDNNDKHIKLSSDVNSEFPAYVRIKLFSPDYIPIDLASNLNSKWKPGENDDWIYYDEALGAGNITNELVAKIGFPEQAKEGDHFNIIVVYEYVPAQYDDNGNPYANWNV